MENHALFVIFEKAANFEIVFCCNLKVVLNGSTYGILMSPSTKIYTLNLGLSIIQLKGSQVAFSKLDCTVNHLYNDTVCSKLSLTLK